MLNRKIKGQEFRKRRPFYFSLRALIDKLKVATIRKFYSTERIENPMEEEQQRREKEKEMWNLKQEKRLCSAWVLTGQEISAKHLTSKCWVVVSIKYSSYKSISFEHAYVMSWIQFVRKTWPITELCCPPSRCRAFICILARTLPHFLALSTYFPALVALCFRNLSDSYLKIWD